MGKRTKKANGFWTKEECYRAASEYKTRSEFKKNYSGGFKAACKNNWLTDYWWFEDGRKLASQKRIIWTKEECYRAASEYKTRTEFQKNCGGGYHAARKNGWLDEFLSKNRIEWTREKCYEEARKYKTRYEFEKNCGSAYNVALKNNWLDGLFPQKREKKPNNFWTKEECYRAASEYKTRTEFQKNCKSGYDAARRKKWLDDYYWFERQQNPFTDKIDNVYCYFFTDFNSVYIGRTVNPQERNCQHRIRGTVYNFARKNKTEVPEMVLLETNLSLEDGLELEDYYVKKFKKEGCIVLNKAKTGKGSGALGALGSGKWTKGECYKTARKYGSRSEFAENCNTGYQVARKNGWLDEYDWFEEKMKPKGFWTKEECYRVAQEYNTRSEFAKNCVSAYNAALKNKWLNELFPKNKKTA